MKLTKKDKNEIMEFLNNECMENNKHEYKKSKPFKTWKKSKIKSNKHFYIQLSNGNYAIDKG